MTTSHSRRRNRRNRPTLAEAVLIRLGQTYGSTREERAMRLPGDHIVPTPQVVTNHAIIIDAPQDCVWPWLVQMGWHRAGWYTARWVDKLLFPLNWPSANRIIPELQHIEIGDFIPDGAPETKCGLIVEELEPGRALALHSTTPSAPQLAGQGVPRLVLGFRAPSPQCGSANSLPVPITMGDRSLVVHLGRLAGNRSGRFRDVPRHAERSEATRRGTGDSALGSACGQRRRLLTIAVAELVRWKPMSG